MLSKTIEEMISDTSDKLVIDVREAKDYEKETYPGAINIYFAELMERKDELPKDKNIYLICYSGKNSEVLCEDLQPLGYSIYSIEGGYYSYLRMQIENFMEDEEQAHNRALASKRIVVEHVFAHIKKFKILGSTYRNFQKKLNLRFNIIAGIHNLKFS